MLDAFIHTVWNWTEYAFEFIEDSWEVIADMNLNVQAMRIYRNNRIVINACATTALFVIFLSFCLRGSFLQFARKAKQSIEGTVASKVEQIANQFDEALRVSYRKATWELVRDNVGVYALQGRRMSMEDRFTFVNRLDHTDTSLYGVFDGHGGEFAAEYTEKALFKKIMTKLLDQSSAGETVEEHEVNVDIEDILKTSTLEVDKTLISILKASHDTSGTTAVVALLRDDMLYVSNVGDSRAVMCDHQLTAIPLSYDHKPDSPDERARIEKAGGYVSHFGVWRVNGILATSRALGDFALKFNDEVSAEPDVRKFSLAEHRPLFMIIATDGLWDVFSNSEAIQFVHNHLTEPDFGAKSLAQEAFTKGSQDNISVIVVNFSAKPDAIERSSARS